MKINLSILLFFTLTILVFGQSNEQTGDDLYALGNYSKAIEAYMSEDFSQDPVYDKIAKAYIAIGNYGEGLNNYQKAIKANPENSLLQFEYAKLLTRTKKYDKAEQLLQNLLVADSLNPNFHYELGLVLEKQNDSSAIKAFINTFELDQTHQKAIFKIAKRHIVKRKFELAHSFIDKGLENYESNIELISLKAQAYYYQEYYTHSVVWFNKLLDLGEKSEFIHEKLSLSYSQNSDYEDAIFHRKEALKYNPYNADAIFVIGTYYERLSNYEKAEEYYKKSLLLKDVSLSNEYLRLGRILNRQKKYDEAIKAFQNAIKEDPTDIMAEFFLIRTKDEYYADVDTKISLYQTFIEKHKDNPFVNFAEERLKELKQEKFLQQDKF
ncbi:tetratricopeptide repeat protein [Winogradskyella sp. A2]|uniref:tetratricopeptide repeat protein n=1 Tax=Winogradskyella sp. A2 TaxID=3366944 RepID=UPI00398C2EC8